MTPLITILTATYNRASLLPRIYESLKSQSTKNFEWLIIDDGSTDNTEQVVSNFNSTDFPISYYKKENGGKHIALNLGVIKARGKYILMLDSDDYLIKTATKIISEKIEVDGAKKQLGAIAFRRIYNNHQIVGTSNFDSLLSDPIDIRYKHKVTGDLVEIFKKEVMIKYPFPTLKEERFCPEILVWNRIGKDYKIMYYNIGIYVTEYLPGGLTDKITKIRMQSPKASMLTYSELSKYKIPFIEKIKASINFWRFSFNDKDWPLRKKLNMSIPWISPIAFPLGFFMYLYDKSKVS